APVTGDPMCGHHSRSVASAEVPGLHSTGFAPGADVVEVSDRLGLTRLYCCARHHSSRCFAPTCGNFRGMRLAGAFFANHAEVVADMLNVEGGVWATTTVAPHSTLFRSSCVVLCDTRRRDVGIHYALHIDA